MARPAPPLLPTRKRSRGHAELRVRHGSDRTPCDDATPAGRVVDALNKNRVDNIVHELSIVRELSKVEVFLGEW